MHFESVSHPSAGFLHTSILTASRLTGAAAESTVQRVSKIPHHTAAERGKKRAVLSPNQFGSWNSAEGEHLWETAAAKSTRAVKFPVLAAERGTGFKQPGYPVPSP